MVRHHVKKSKKGGAAGKQAAPSEVSKAELDRFAGSSDEEEDDNNSSDNDEEEQDEELEEPMNDLDDGSSSDDSSDSVEPPVQQGALTVRKEIAMPSVSSDDDSSSDEDEEELVNRPAPSQVGMASAMSRILGTTMSSVQAKKKPDPSVVVLSRTTTPLQKAQLEEKSRLSDAKQKRSTNRERNLACMHVPLSVATTAVVGAGSGGSVARELEMERMHRRVATRGVVALFNAISQHKAETKQLEIQNVDPLKAAKQQKGADVSKLTKFGFLDMIRKTATDDATKEETTSKPNHDKEQASTKKSGTSGGWSALKDDFMMNSKLKDWDKAMSEDGESSSDDEQANNADGGVQDEWSDDDGGDKRSTRKRETEGREMSSKKRRVRT
eukprot:scaffold69292_cov59-Attheya_sp.AAC.1